MLLDVIEGYRVNCSDGKNFVPEFFSEGGEEITFGKAKGQTTQSKWKSYDKYFSSLSGAVDYIANQCIADMMKNKAKEEDMDEVRATVGDFIKSYREISESIRERVSLGESMFEVVAKEAFKSK